MLAKYRNIHALIGITNALKEAFSVLWQLFHRPKQFRLGVPSWIAKRTRNTKHPIKNPISIGLDDRKSYEA